MGVIFPIITSFFNKSFAINKISPSLENKIKSVAFRKNFKDLNDRVWIGKSFWAVPMEDWSIKGGRLEFSGIEKNSRLHLLTHVLEKGNGEFGLNCSMGLLNNKEDSGSIGFTVGIKDSTDEESIKAACYYGEGVSVGISLDGIIFIGDKKAPLPHDFNFDGFTMKLTVLSKGEKNQIHFLVEDNNKRREELKLIHSGELSGLVSLESNMLQKNQSTFWCNDIELSGSKVEYKPGNSFGPILWSMYTLSGNILKISAQLPPIGLKDTKNVGLQFLKDGKWAQESYNEIDPESYTAIFRIDDWDSTLSQPYRLVYEDKVEDFYEGEISAEPLNRPLKFGGLTCQEWGGYPYRPLVENLEKCNPDILYFSGDQLYEPNGGYPIKRQPEDKAILSYLGKWYMFGWAFGNIMRDRPTICTPDDHDVFQGNLWGESGKNISFEAWENVKDAHGGFVQSVKMVNVVNRTQCAHLPDPYHNSDLKSGMTIWYTGLNYGRVSFAIVSDRIFKTGPQSIRSGSGRIDHVKVPLKPKDLDSDKLSLMGKGQMDFLNNWVTEWEEVDMKVLLSQTLFSNVATHHGGEKQFIYGDLDSGGWPKSQRDEVLQLIRKACALHINGDQHLPFLVQYGVENPRDSGWTFCTPAISTGYPRWGQPDLVNMPFFERPSHNLPNTGCYRDIFGNDNFVYAVGNPQDDFQTEKNRYIRCQKKSSGFGMVTFNTIERTIKMDAIRFLANLDIDSEGNRFPGWPLTIHQLDNDGRKPIGYLPQINLEKPNGVLKIINEDSGELVKCIRINGNLYKPSVYERAKYTLIIGIGEEEQIFQGIEITPDSKMEIKVG